MNYYWGFANDFSDEFDDSDVLEHHGILGMKWGIRRYQPYGVGYNAKNKGKFIGSRERRLERTTDKISKTIEKAKKARSAGDVSKLNKLNAKVEKLTIKSDKLKEKIEKKRLKDEAKAEAIKEARDFIEKRKQEAIKKEKLDMMTRADVDEIISNSSKFSTNELQDVINRSQKLSTLEAMSRDKKTEKFNRAISFTKKIVDAGKTSIDAYQTYNKIKDLTKDKTAIKEAEKVARSGDIITLFENRNMLDNKQFEDAFKRVVSTEKLDDKYRRLVHSEIDVLCHHGVKGQKWGVRNGPPYPLKNKKNKANKKEATKTSKTTKTTKKDEAEFKVGITHLSAPDERFWRESVKASDLSRIMNVAEGIMSGELSHLKRLKRESGKIQMSDAIDVNMRRNVSSDSGYANNASDPGLYNNCAKCSASLFLRALGYDVQAGRSAHGALSTAGEYWFDGAVPYKEKSIENLEKRMASFGRQGKGMLGCRRADGSGHSVYFQNERGEDGKYKTVIYDGQIGRKYDSLKDLFDAESFDESQFSRITNLSTATPNWEHLAEDSVSRVNYKNRDLNVVQNIKDGRVFTADNLRFT